MTYVAMAMMETIAIPNHVTHLELDRRVRGSSEGQEDEVRSEKDKSQYE